MAHDYSSVDISVFLHYLASHPEADDRLPALKGLSRDLGISVAALREQLEVARALGLVDVRPHTGTRRLHFSFTPAVRQSLRYALALEDGYFQKFADLRNHVEIAYWNEAVCKLTEVEKFELNALIHRAREKLGSTPPLVPHEEHRKLHLVIYSRLDNPFVTGILEAYWDAYEAVGLNLYAGGMDYLNEVWGYHAEMVECICNGNFDAGREVLTRHVDLLAHRPS